MNGSYLLYHFKWSFFCFQEVLPFYFYSLADIKLVHCLIALGPIEMFYSIQTSENNILLCQLLTIKNSFLCMGAYRPHLACTKVSRDWDIMPIVRNFCYLFFCFSALSTFCSQTLGMPRSSFQDLCLHLWLILKWWNNTKMMLKLKLSRKKRSFCTFLLALLLEYNFIVLHTLWAIEDTRVVGNGLND